MLSLSLSLSFFLYISLPISLSFEDAIQIRLGCQMGWTEKKIVTAASHH
jgi:hypothetical protein